jgi:hypothetical protein
VKVSASATMPGRISEAEALWYDVSRWPNFVDGFSHTVQLDQTWPAEGKLIWDSTPHGRGRVLERVVRHEVRVGQTSEVEDEKLRGTQTVAFEATPDGGTRFTIALEYELKERTPFTAIADLLFIRRAMRESLQRTASRFARERRGDAELLPA